MLIFPIKNQYRYAEDYGQPKDNDDETGCGMKDING